MFYCDDARKRELFFLIKTNRTVYTIQTRNVIEKASEEYFYDHYTLSELIEYGVFSLIKFNEKIAKVECNHTIKLMPAQSDTAAIFNKGEALSIQVPCVVVTDLKEHYGNKYVK